MRYRVTVPYVCPEKEDPSGFLQLFTIRDPLEVESAKSRRFVLIPIEKLKLSRVGHDGTQMMSFLFVSVVRPLMEVTPQ